MHLCTHATYLVLDPTFAQVGDRDLEEKAEGRLLPAHALHRRQRWVHVHCAVWCSEVYENEEGQSPV